MAGAAHAALLFLRAAASAALRLLKRLSEPEAKGGRPCSSVTIPDIFAWAPVPIVPTMNTTRVKIDRINLVCGSNQYKDLPPRFVPFMNCDKLLINYCKGGYTHADTPAVTIKYEQYRL